VPLWDAAWLESTSLIMLAFLNHRADEVSASTPAPTANRVTHPPNRDRLGSPAVDHEAIGPREQLRRSTGIIPASCIHEQRLFFFAELTLQSSGPRRFPVFDDVLHVGL
jgi:hypothetical protein